MAIDLPHAARATVRVRLSFRALLMAGSMLAAGVPLMAMAQSALPSGGTVEAGSAVITSSPGQTLISQSTKNAVIDWTDFSVGKGNTVQFNNGSGATLNRVTGSGISSIDGLVSATGSVYLLNANGVIIGKTGVVKTGGSFVASTQNIGNSAFMAGGDLSLSGASQASVINLGQVSALGGDVVMAALTVRNDGSISAPNGTVGLLGGQSFVLRDKALDDGKFLVVTNASAGSVTNTGAINAAAAELRAEGGNVYALAGNTNGVIRATGVATRDGKVFLTAGEGGTVSVSGTDISAQASSGGGFIETSAGTVKIADSASISTRGADGSFGTWLIDPTDFTVAASGGDMTGAALSTSLASGNITLLSSGGASGTNGNININDAVTWSANTTLTLNAYRNINISKTIISSGASGKLALFYGQGAVAAGNAANYYLTGGAAVFLHAGLNFSTKLGSNGSTTPYTVITTLGAAGSVTGTDLQGINGNLSGNYVLGANIDAVSTTEWNAGAGFTPIGNSGTAFSGHFDGLGHAVKSLTIDNLFASYVGLFGNSSGMIRNVTLLGGSITAYSYVGGLVGNNTGSVSYVTSTASVDSVNFGGANIGGLIGYNNTSTPLINSAASGAVTAGKNATDVGGLIGENDFSSLSGDVALGNVSVGDGAQRIGGLVGYDLLGAIGNSNSTGNVSVNGSGNYLGGLAGYISGNIYSTTVAYSNATGDVSTVKDGHYMGGLVGYSGSIAYSWVRATGAVNNGGTTNIGAATGGLIGDNEYGNITGGIANGNVSVTTTGSYGGSAVGGLIGLNRGYGSSSGNISSSNSTGSVTVGDHASDVGGLVGMTLDQPVNGQSNTISNSNAAGNVISGINSYEIGGLIGGNEYAFVSRSFETGDVSGGSGSSSLGGLIGNNFVANVFKSYATGAVSSSGSGQDFGGLIGSNVAGTIFTSHGPVSANDAGSITGSYATGAVSSVNEGRSFGGLVGHNEGAIDSSWASGNLSSGVATYEPGSDYGGLVGWNSGYISNSHATGNINVAASQYGWGTTVGTIHYGGGYGGLLGYNTGNVTNTYASGAVTTPFATDDVGGLIGQSASGTIDNSSAVGTLTVGEVNYGDPTASVGGLIGSLDGTLTNSRAYGNVIVGNATDTQGGATEIGGLVGTLASGSVSSSYATGSIMLEGDVPYQAVGGLIGKSAGNVQTSFAAGNVSAPNIDLGTSTLASDFGGLVGDMASGSISDSYANGNVSAGDSSTSAESMFGGLIGLMDSGTVSNTYSTGQVSGATGSNMTGFGGLIGSSSSGTVTSSFWATDLSGLNVSAGGMGVKTAALHDAATFAGWDLGTTGGTSTVWRIYPGQTAPLLRTFLKPLDISGLTATVTYNGADWILVPAWPSGVQSSRILGSAASGTNPGTYTSSYYSNQFGYDIIGQASLTIN